MLRLYFYMLTNTLSHINYILAYQYVSYLFEINNNSVTYRDEKVLIALDAICANFLVLLCIFWDFVCAILHIFALYYYKF